MSVTNNEIIPNVFFSINDEVTLRTLARRWNLSTKIIVETLSECGIAPFLKEIGELTKRSNVKKMYELVHEKNQHEEFLYHETILKDNEDTTFYGDVYVDVRGLNGAELKCSPHSTLNKKGQDEILLFSEMDGFYQPEVEASPSWVYYKGEDIKLFEQDNGLFDHGFKPKQKVTSADESLNKTALKVIGLLMLHLNKGKYTNNGKPNRSQLKGLLQELASKHNIKNYGLDSVDERILKLAWDYIEEQKIDKAHL